MADFWTADELNRIAKALELAGYKEAAEFVALAALSVRDVSTLRFGRKRPTWNFYQLAAAPEPARSVVNVVPFPSRRRIDRSS